jgi:hypothetical protein
MKNTYYRQSADISDLYMWVDDFVCPYLIDRLIEFWHTHNLHVEQKKYATNTHELKRLEGYLAMLQTP